MKNVIVPALALSLTACAGVKTRTAEEWRTDIGQGFAAHSTELKACYDSSGVKTKVAITLTLAAAKHKDANGGSNPVTVQSVAGGDAPAALVECVKHAAASIDIRPEDKHDANGSWVVTFDPAVGAGASLDVAPAAPKA